MRTSGTNPLDAWSNSLGAGREVEAKLAQALERHLGWSVTVNNAVDERATDLLVTLPTGVTFPMDVKYLKSPYPSEPSPSGLLSWEHLTLDYSNVMEYSDDTVIMCAVSYEPEGLYCISARHARNIISANPKRIYIRSARSFKDKSKKIGISKDECRVLCFPGMDSKATFLACDI